MRFKTLLVTFIILTCIEINDGLNYESDKDNHGSYFLRNDFITDLYSPFPGTPTQQENVNTNEGLSTNVNQDVNEEQAKQKFREEYSNTLNYYPWHDLLNDTYNDSWYTLCFKLWKYPVLTKKCGAHKIIHLLSSRPYRVIGRHDKIENYFDFLNCVCPFKVRTTGARLLDSEHYFYVIPSLHHQQHYFIMRYKGRYKVEVFDMRKAEFDPRNDILGYDDFSGGPPSSEEEKFEDFQLANIVANNEPSINSNQEANEKLAKEKFQEEYPKSSHYYHWPDLINNAYNDSLSKLCYALWKEPIQTKKCKADTKIYQKKSSHKYRVIGWNDQYEYFVDLLQCVCPFRLTTKGRNLFDSDHHFYIVPSRQRRQQYYFILRYVGKCKVEVFDLRMTRFGHTNPV